MNDDLQYQGDSSSFMTSLFANTVQPPFSFFFQLDGGDSGDLTRMVSTVLTTGSDLRYGKQFHELSETERRVMRGYLLSLGWDYDYNTVILTKEVLDYHPDGVPYVHKLKINNRQLTFKSADRMLAPNASCHSALNAM